MAGHAGGCDGARGTPLQWATVGELHAVGDYEWDVHCEDCSVVQLCSAVKMTETGVDT